MNLTRLLTLFFVFVVSQQFAQICLGDDITVCAGSTVTINNCSGGTGGGTTGGGVYLDAPGSVSLSDDMWSGVIPIGFNFDFYGVPRSQCVIGSNGLISFDITKANGYCAWSFTGITPLPNSTFVDAQNAAMCCYQDMNPGLGGSIEYQTVGTAPNRMFVVLYKEIPTFSCGECSYMSIILFEGSNNVEFHIGNKPPCTSWNSGLALQGTENPTGTAAHVTPGRNITQWSANQECKRFTPTSPSNTNSYTISTEPYTLVTSSGTSIMWGNTLGQTFPYNNGTLVTPPIPAGTTGYFLTGTACNVGIGAISDTSWITGLTSSVTATATPDICSSGVGTATATATSGTAPYTFSWSNGATVNSISNLHSGVYTVVMTDAIGCSSNASVVVGDTPATFSGTTTLVSCPGGSDGSATVSMTPMLGNLTYQWNDPAAQTTATATGLNAGSYQCAVTSDIGCTGTVNVTVTEIPAMVINTILLTDVSCNSGDDGSVTIGVSQGTGTAPFTYSWTSTSSLSSTAAGLTAGNYTATITDSHGCTTTHTITIDEPAPLQITFITSPIQICPEASTTLTATAAGGSSPYIFTWFENGSQIGTSQTITVDPDFTNTQYCVTLSEACGSPITDTCTLITFPTPIVPDLVPDRLKDCVPATFDFYNTSSNLGEIQSVYYQFSDGNAYTIDGSNSVTNTFEDPAFYACQMTVTSIYGCVYVATIQDIIEAKPVPNAEFTFTDNPATIFETTVGMQDQSTGDVVNWYWDSPGSTPMSSSAQNPTLTFPPGEVGQYPVTLIVYTDFGCTDTVMHEMNIVPDVIIFAPNTFTPDGNEFNQEWTYYISGIDVYDFVIYIFDRWGEVVWESHDPSVSWDGTYKGHIVPQGTYSWRATAKDVVNDNVREFFGHVNVIR